MSEPRFAAILLAAGASTRMGRPKQLIRLGGESLLRHAARMATEAGCAPVVVVLGDRADQMRSELDGLPVLAAVNEDWAEGMGSSLRFGMISLSGMRPAVAGVLVLVCDQPGLSSEHLRRLLLRQAAGTALVTASLYGGRAGVPAVFAPALFPKLAALEGDRGARDLIRGHEDEVETVSWPEGALDLDGPEDLKAVGAQ